MRVSHIAMLMILLIISLPFASAVSLSYDANGNLINDGVFRYVYDDYDNLARIENADGVVSEFFYDASGQRVKKVENGETTYYVGDLVRVVKDGAVTDTIYYSDDFGLVAKEDSTGIEFYHPDHLGSPVLMTDASGAVVSESSFLPFGLSLSGNTDRYGFTGQENEVGELQYFNARYYSPVLRRFTQPDTILPDIYDPQQLNRYSYVRNNPVKYNDPSGNFIHIAIGAVIGAGANLIKQVWLDDRSLFDGSIDWRETLAWSAGGAAGAATGGMVYAAYGGGFLGAVAAGAAGGLIGGGTTQATGNVLYGNPWYQDVFDVSARAQDIMLGAVFGGGGYAVASAGRAVARGVSGVLRNSRAQVRIGGGSTRQSRTNAPTVRLARTNHKAEYTVKPGTPKSQSPEWQRLKRIGEPFKQKKGVIKIGQGKKAKFYDYDHLHRDHIEVFNHKKIHLGGIDPTTGEWVKKAKAGRHLLK